MKGSLVLLPLATAFAPTPSLRTTTLLHSTAPRNLQTVWKDLVEQYKTSTASMVDSVRQSAAKIDAWKEQTTQGDLGQRGEAWVVAQVVLWAAIGTGFLPVLGPVVQVVLGPGALVLGVALVLAATIELGSVGSPWTTTPTNLVTTGVYAHVRHPLDAGALLAAIGWSVSTGNVTSLLFSGLLAVLLQAKVDFEEAQMMGKDYAEYARQVPDQWWPAKSCEQAYQTVQDKLMISKKK